MDKRNQYKQQTNMNEKDYKYGCVFFILTIKYKILRAKENKINLKIT